MGAPLSSENRTIFFIADVGTTTIKASLCASGNYQLPDTACDTPLAFLSEKNAQSVFGMDVVSRILYAHYHGTAPLQKKVLSQLLSLFISLCKTAAIEGSDVSGFIITGNTVMLHLVRGLSVKGFEMAPFSPSTVDAAEIPFGTLFKGCSAFYGTVPDSSLPASETPVFFPPCIDAFIGADAVCAALYAMSPVCGNLQYPLLIADVGTNTEILMISPAKVDDAAGCAESGIFSLVCCSTAAGPAFEGGVLCGHYTGSELVHMLSDLLKTGVMDETGLLSESSGSLDSAQKPSSLPVTQDAVRQLQLAKGAVCAAIETLLKEEGRDVEDIGTFVLCGNFGSALSAEESERIGLFPAGLAAATVYAGNASELGARLLMSEEMREKAKKIAVSGKLIQLADNRFFARRYIERMNFSM